MVVPSDPPAVTPAGFQTWSQNVSDTAQDHDSRLDTAETTLAGKPDDADITSAIQASVKALPPLRPAVSDYVMSPSVSRGSSTLTADRVHFVPLWVPEAISIDQLGCELVTAAGATATMRLGLYEHDETDQRPGALVVDAGTVDGTAGPGAKTVTVDETLAAGLYWLAGAAQGADAALPSWRTATGPMWMLPITGTPTGSGQSIAYVESGVAGALSDPSGVGAVTITTVAPVLFARRSA